MILLNALLSILIGIGVFISFGLGTNEWKWEIFALAAGSSMAVTTLYDTLSYWIIRRFNK